MTEQDFHQLRFDICENVRLHTQQPSIGTLLELDLCPDVEIKDRGNHLKIEGVLRLKGLYLTEESAETRQLEEDSQEEISYVIPVEITLPADRAEMEQISAEIESFDYQVLSPFELQIDAVLLIDGLIPEQHVQQPSVEKDVPMFSGAEASLEMEIQSESEDDPSEEVDSNQNTEEQTYEYHENKEESQEINRQSEQDIQPSTTQKEEEDNPTLVSEKKLENQEGVEESKESNEELTDSVTMDEHEEETDVSSEEDWAHWLIGEKEENFASMRMVIVQDQESIQQLAERYEVSPTMIRQVNQLDDQELSKGQIVYIPNQD